MDWTVYGIVPIVVIGAAVGSFLNVVIFRLPRGLSVASPRWSFCPACSQRIPPEYNIPVLGYLILRGRCRNCRAPISVLYPLIELLCALVFLMTWDALFVSQVIPSDAPFVNAVTTPILIAYLVLFAGLLACAAMDLESYTIHIQLPLIVVAVGTLAHGIVGVVDSPSSRHAVAMTSLPPALCGISLTLGVTWLASCIVPWRRPAEPSGIDTPHQPMGVPESDQSCTENKPASASIASPPTTLDFLIVAMLALAVMALTLWVIFWPQIAFAIVGIPAGGQRAMLACCVFMIALVSASFVHREVDQQIVDDLDRERPQARRMAWLELRSFIPAIVVGFVVLVWLRATGRVGVEWDVVQVWASKNIPLGNHLLAGLTALAHAILAAAVGWSVRILGTFAFGKEAFGSGDIFLMSAIGAVGGIWLVLIGFLLSAVLALVGVLATSFRRSCRAIPFGPWLALGAFAGMWVQRPLVELFSPLGWLIWEILSGAPD